MPMGMFMRVLGVMIWPMVMVFLPNRMAVSIKVNGSMMFRKAMGWRSGLTLFHIKYSLFIL